MVFYFVKKIIVVSYLHNELSISVKCTLYTYAISYFWCTHILREGSSIVLVLVQKVNKDSKQDYIINTVIIFLMITIKDCILMKLKTGVLGKAMAFLKTISSYRNF